MLTALLLALQLVTPGQCDPDGPGAIRCPTTLLPGYSSVWTNGVDFWSGNPFCADSGVLPMQDSPTVDAGAVIEGFHCPASGSSEGQPRLLIAGWLDSPCSEWFGTAPDIGACGFIPVQELKPNGGLIVDVEEGR